MTTSRHSIAAALCAIALLSACGGSSERGSDTSVSTSTPAETPAATTTTTASGGGGEWSTTPLTPESGRKVVEVQMETDAQGNNKFTPAKFEVHQGDVVRFTLKSGVHNVHFLADSNRTRTGYISKASDLLQLPGQTLDVKINWPEGKYYFQCDPHALLGMIGHMEVED